MLYSTNCLAIDRNDQETCTTIRRHFHTLKGSGRMVGAKSAGEIGMGG